MRTTALAVLGVLAAALSAANAVGLTADRTVHCPPMPSGVVVDGVLDELTWQLAPLFTEFINLNGSAPKEPTAAWVAYGLQGLYFAFECIQKEMKPDNSPDRKEVWLDDSVEVFIDVNGDRATYQHFLVGAAGSKLHERIDTSGTKHIVTSVEWEASTRIQPGKWTAELFIPYSTLDAALSEGSVVRVNVVRNNPTVGESSSWASSIGGFHQPLNFGNLVAGVPRANIKLSANAGEIITAGASQVRVWCFNQSEEEVQVAATLYPGNRILKSDVPLVIPAGKQLTAYVDADFDGPGIVNLKLAAASTKDGRILAQTSFRGAVTAHGPAGGVVSSGKWGVLWDCTATYKVMRQTPPPSDKTTAIRLYAARNEFEPFQLVLRPTTKVTNVKVTPRSLTGPGNARIDAWNINVRNVEYVHVGVPTSADVEAGMYPDPLPEFQPFTASAGNNNPVWITVFVPPTAPPGEYKGSVEVTGDGIDKQVVPIILRVWGFTLPTVSNLRTAYGFNLNKAAQYHGATTIEQKRRLTELYNLDSWRHRIAPYRPDAFYDLKAGLENGTVTVDFSDFDVAVGKFFPLFNSFMLPHFGIRDTAGIDMGGDYPRFKIDFMRTVAEHLIDKGQLSKGYNYIFDEPTAEQYEMVSDEAKLSRMADSRIKVLLTEQVEPELVGSVDIWCPILPEYDEERSKARQAAGEEIWWYVCCAPHHPYPNNFIDYPAIDHRILHWITWRYGVNGILYWQTMYWRDNPWDVSMSYTPSGDNRWGNGDGNLLYPPVRKPSDKFVDKGPVPSLRWEIIREGMEDYEYFYILKTEMEKAKAAARNPAAVKEAEEALKLVDSCAQSRTSYCTDPAKLDRVRVRIAKAIEALGK